jgi:hypothetical protein
MRPAYKVDFTGVSDNKLSTLIHCFLYLQSDYWMVLCCVGSDSQDAFGIANLSYRVSHSAAAEACGQTGHSGCVSEAGTVVDIVGAHHRPGEFLENEIIFVGAFGRRYSGELITFTGR